MRVPIAVYSGARICAPRCCSAAIATRTGPSALAMPSRYSSERSSRSSLSTARLITRKCTSISRTFSTSRIQREVIQHHGQSGSNQKSACDFSAMARSFPLASQLLLRHHRSRRDAQHGPPRPQHSPPHGPAAPLPLRSTPERTYSPSVAVVCPLRRRSQQAPRHATSTGAPTGMPTSKLGEVTLPNLTRDQAIERAAWLTVEGYQIALDLTDGAGGPGQRTFRSTTTVTFDALAGADTVIDLAATRVHRATLNGVDIDVSGYDESTGIALRGLADHNVVHVDADCAYSNTGEGLHRFVDPVDDEVYLYSQFEIADVKRMFACFDQPDLKATFAITVTAPLHWQVVSNGATSDVRDGVHTFATTQPMSTYLVALIAGPYAKWTDVYRDEHGEIPLGIFCRASLAEHMDAERLFTETKQGFGFYHKHFGITYPFGKYDQLFVPEFNAGAMENVGAVTFLEDYVFRSKVTRASYERRAETLLHEMAHMWFGDLVTMRWWDDLWLNESFATWASVLAQSEATRWEQAWTTFAVTEKLWALRQDQLPSTHPIAADIRDLDDVEVNCDGITYAKGASVLKQLVAYVGREEFLAGVRAYFDEHAWANSELGDLFIQLERQGGRDLATWGQQWLQTAGVNTLSPVVEVDESGTYTSVTIEQSAPDEHPTLRTHRMAIGLYDFDGRVYVRRDRIELDVEGERTEIPQLRGMAQPDLLLLNDDDLTFSKVRLDERSLASVVEHIDALPALPRALVWTAATDMLRDAELPAREYVDLVLSGLPTETSITVVQHVLRVARAAIETMSHPGNRLLLSSHWVISIRRLANEADPGSDLQLALARTWFAAARTPEQLEPIRKLLDSDDGGEVLPGLCVDTDLRWAIVQSRASKIGRARW